MQANRRIRTALFYKTMLIYKVYRDGVFNLDPRSSSAQSMVLMIIVVVLTVLQFRFVERRVTY